MSKKINVVGSCVSRVSLLDGEVKAHGITDDDLSLGYFLDKQNIVLAMMPNPFTVGEVESISEKELYNPKMLRALQQCLNKRTVEMIMESEADYLVMDFYDFHNDFAVFRNTAFGTMFHEFFNTNLFQKYKGQIQTSNFMKIPTWVWYPYVDLFFEKILCKYDANHIILNRFRSNQYYLAKDGKVKELSPDFKRPWHSNDKYNDGIRRLEDYVIQKYNPYVIDLSQFFMGEECEQWDLNGAHFESRFYQETFLQIKKIILGSEAERYFSKPSFLQDMKTPCFSVDRPFDVEYALQMIPKLVENQDMLWLNLLNKCYAYEPENTTVQMYMKVFEE